MRSLHRLTRAFVHPACHHCLEPWPCSASRRETSLLVQCCARLQKLLKRKLRAQ